MFRFAVSWFSNVLLKATSQSKFCLSLVLCPSFSGPKVLKTRVCDFAIFNFSEKLQNIFEIGFKKIWSDCTKIALKEKIFENKKFAVTIVFFIS